MKIIITIITLIVSIFIIGILFILANIIESSKYDYILEKDEFGNWNEVPVYHPCGELIDEEFIKLWHERREQYKKEMHVSSNLSRKL